MVRKFFPLDKNHLLEEAQLSVANQLLQQLVTDACTAYVHLQNPLGLNDAFSERILRYVPTDLEPLMPFYTCLAAMHRFRHGENQLSFVWDGKDHVDHYRDQWVEAFKSYSEMLLGRTQFMQAVLDLSVFSNQNAHPQLASNRMQAVLQDLFELRLHKTRGIVQMKIA